MVSSTPIPGPHALPFIGNYFDINPLESKKSLTHIAEIYGEIFKLNLGGSDRIFVSSYDLINELCDEKRFTKVVAAALKEIRNCVHDGLFTANYGEHAWGVAHRILIPAFGPLSIRNMFDEMHDISSQLVMKWARFGPDEKIDVPFEFTKLTLDSLALCAMGTRFNSFYREEMHPFIPAMGGMLLGSGARARRTEFVNDRVLLSEKEKYESDIKVLRGVAASVVEDRKKHPTDKKDLLNAMLNGRDPQTGEGLKDEEIMNNMITFLIAGHETTSGTLSFLFYYLLKNPAAYQAAQKEVDDVVGSGPVTADHMSKIPYINACLRETLRLQPPVYSIGFQVLPDSTEDSEIIGRKYEIKKGQSVAAIVSVMHRDPKIYGEDADSFRPERMFDEPFSKLPPNAWKPFGNGARACIGRPFAWQEAQLTICLLLQNFNFRMDDPSYDLLIRQTLTIKPKDFYMHATLRDHIDAVALEKRLQVASPEKAFVNQSQSGASASTANGQARKPMTILYGSNAGTCESLAQTLARAASSHGFEVAVKPLDSATEKVPENEPVVMICSSYEGQPPDNAAHFVTWLTELKEGDRLAKVKYAVFAVGNHDWAATFHRIPKLLDSCFAANGATRIAKMGLVDVAADDVFNEFDKWQDEVFWPSLGAEKTNEEDAVLEMEIDTLARGSKLRQDVQEAVVLSNELLTKEGEPQKRYISLQLPSDLTYKAGDYLAVLPINSVPNVRRVLRRFNLPWDVMLTLKPGAQTTLPTGHPISAADIFGAYVELSQPATRKNVQRIAASIVDEKKREELLLLGGDKFETEISAKHVSVLDILERYPEAQLPLNEFITMLPPMRVRQYSISSSPLADSSVATLTWTVLDAPSKAGGKRFLGVASNYLARVEEGDRVHVAVRPSHGNFHLPADIETTPIIMICAGTGIAPFHGFIQERAVQISAGRKLAPAYLFVGCNHPEKDKLFADEIKQWEADGVVKVYYAFMQATEQSKGAKFVQDRVWEEREEMTQAFIQGARVYICGSNLVGKGVTAAVKKIYKEALEKAGRSKSDEEIDAWFESIRSDRYVADVFS